MRYIDLEEVRRRLPPDWEARAEQALDEVRAVPEEDRVGAVNARRQIWRDLKDQLEEVSYGKCWYCESIQDRSDNAVDHYRPKSKNLKNGNVQGEHKGYWWLAFKWQNYRYSCTYCNSRRKDPTTGRSGGKHDSFPLFNPSETALRETDDIEIEQPYLLDPTVPTDPGLLWFEPDGRAVPKYKEENYPRYYQRALVSIDLYNLDYYKTKLRREDLYRYIRQLVEDGNRYFYRAAEGDRTVAHALNQVVYHLNLLIRPNAEFSAAATAYLMGFKDSTWVEAVISSS